MYSVMMLHLIPPDLTCSELSFWHEETHLTFKHHLKITSHFTQKTNRRLNVETPNFDNTCLHPHTVRAFLRAVQCSSSLLLAFPSLLSSPSSSRALHCYINWLLSGVNLPGTNTNTISGHQIYCHLSLSKTHISQYQGTVRTKLNQIFKCTTPYKTTVFAA